MHAAIFACCMPSLRMLWCCQQARPMHLSASYGFPRGSIKGCIPAAGAVLVIIICFMAVTSSGASEMLAVSSLYTFDFYRRYINPKVDKVLPEIITRFGCVMYTACIPDLWKPHCKY